MAVEMLVAVDIGNSSTKFGWGFGGGAAALPLPSECRSFSTGQTPGEDILGSLPRENCRWHIASVHREGTRLLTEWIAAQRPADSIRLLTHLDLPIATSVDFPDRVGLDRLAAAVAANSLRRAGTPAIVIDAGSAITVDLVAADGAFEGGVILPGFRMAAEALYGADLLPLSVLDPNEAPPQVVGKNTQAAIRSGLFWGAVGAVREVAQRMAAELHPAPDVFVTGGDLRQLAQHLGERARFVPHMVLSGIAIAAQRG